MNTAANARHPYRHRWGKAACAGMYCLLPIAAEAAAPDHFELSPEQLFNATVTSVSKTSEKLMDAPAAVYVLTNEDIMRSGATSIPEALRLAPGVQVARTHAGGWAVSVRGFNSGLANKLLVLMDGREVYDPLFSGVYWDMQDTVLEDIERIEIIRGPGATLWGANAVNGVINIITKSARDTQGGMISALAGNQDRNITAARYGGKSDDEIYYRGYGKYLDRDEARTRSGGGARDSQEAFRGGFRADWNADSGADSITLQGDVAKSSNGQFRVSPLQALMQERINSSAWNIIGRFTRELPGDSRLTVQSYLDYSYRDQLLLTDQRISFDADVQYELPAYRSHKIITGGKYRLSDDSLSPSEFITASRLSRHDQIVSGFVQDKITLAPDQWFLTLGSKFEHNDYSGFEVQPSARLQWNIDETQMVWTSVARAVRTPSQLEQDLTITFISIGGFGPLFGLESNPDFESEELVTYEAGYRKQITQALSLDTALFYNDYDKISSTSVTAGGSFPITTRITNGTKAETYGGEATLNWRASERLHFSTSYSYLDMQLHGPSNAIDAEAAENQSPQHQFNTRSQWNIYDNLSLDTTAYYVSALRDFGVKPYWRFDAGLSWNVTDTLNFKLVGQDLLSDSHREFTAADDPFTPAAEIEPSFYGKLTWRF